MNIIKELGRIIAGKLSQGLLTTYWEQQAQIDRYERVIKKIEEFRDECIRWRDASEGIGSQLNVENGTIALVTFALDDILEKA